jgi:hypothetical protein
MDVDTPEKPSLDDRIRRRIGMLLRQTYEDQLDEELPSKLATKLDRLRPTSESAASHSRWPAFTVPDRRDPPFWLEAHGEIRNGVVYWPSLVSFWGGAPPRRRSASILNSNSANAGSPKTAGHAINAIGRAQLSDAGSARAARRQLFLNIRK